MAKVQQEPEIEREGMIEDFDSNTLALLNKSEIDQQITTAKKFPRSIKQFINEAIEMATLDEETAGECIYALPRDGRTIEGPSARLAEIVFSAWGNSRAGARVVDDQGEFVTAQGAFYDLQRNVAISYEVKRRIVDKHGRRYNLDMIGVTSNAACSVAMRNAIFKGIPKAFWGRIYQAARKVVAGDFKTLANRRAEAVKQFQVFGVTPEMIFKVLAVKGTEDITIDHLVALKGMLTALAEGDTTVEQLFGEAEKQAKAAANVAKATTEKTAAMAEKFTRKPQPEKQAQDPEWTGNEEELARPTSAPEAEPEAPSAQDHKRRGRGSVSQEVQGEAGIFDKQR